ncbi:MAG: hypothetical protein HY290_33720 [Planctomycetia bacterium]|nr:hypothetical protein [Planctomycetia bacterium]
MDVLDRIAEPLAVIGAFAMLAVIVRTAAQCIRAFVQGINEADDPRYAKLPPTSPDLPAPRIRFATNARSIRTATIWIVVYVASVVLLFVSLTSGGWVRLSYEPELIFSLVVPLLVLRIFAYFLRLGAFIRQRLRRRS